MADLLQRALEAVEHLCDADPPWSDILETGRQLVGGESAVFMTFDGRGAVSMESLYLDDRAFSEYTQHFHVHDIGLSMAMSCGSGTWINSEELLTPKALSRSPYYADYMCKHRMRQILCHVVHVGPRLRGGLSFQADVVDEKVRDRLDRPAIRTYTQALHRRLQMRSEAVAQRVRTLDDVFDALDEAFCLVARDGSICHVSRGATALLEDRCSTLRVRSGRLWHPVDAVRALLDAAIRATASTGRRCDYVLGGNTNTSFRLELARAGASLSLGTEALVLVRIVRGTAHPNLELLCAQLSITAAEARVLQLLIEGVAPSDVARRGGASLNTVRKQIAQVMDKAGCTRMVDLVRLCLSAGPLH